MKGYNKIQLKRDERGILFLQTIWLRRSWWSGFCANIHQGPCKVNLWHFTSIFHFLTARIIFIAGLITRWLYISAFLFIYRFLLSRWVNLDAFGFHGLHTKPTRCRALETNLKQEEVNFSESIDSNSGVEHPRECRGRWRPRVYGGRCPAFCSKLEDLP